MWKRRLTVFLIMSSILVVIGAMLHPQPMRKSPLNEDFFFFRKIEARPPFRCRDKPGIRAR